MYFLHKLKLVLKNYRTKVIGLKIIKRLKIEERIKIINIKIRMEYNSIL